MPMNAAFQKRAFQRWVAVASSACSLALPVAAIGSALVVPACLFGSPGPSKVGQGQQYFSEEPSYDRFFASLYDAQVALGKAPDAEAQARGRIAQALALEVGASASVVGKALEKRVEALGKKGTVLQVRADNLDGDAPSVTATVTGTPAGPKDKSLVDAVTQAGPALAGLIVTSRKTAPKLDELETQARALEPGVDVTFRKGGARKKAEVRKNLDDALRLIPLMRIRAAEVEKNSRAMIDALVTAAPAAAPLPTGLPADGKLTLEEEGPGAAKPKVSAPKVRLDETSESKPAPKKAPPPPDDFEP